MDKNQKGMKSDDKQATHSKDGQVKSTQTSKASDQKIDLEKEKNKKLDDKKSSSSNSK